MERCGGDGLRLQLLLAQSVMGHCLTGEGCVECVSQHQSEKDTAGFPNGSRVKRPENSFAPRVGVLLFEGDLRLSYFVLIFLLNRSRQ